MMGMAENVPTTVWIVEVGEYEQRYVQSVFATKQLAEDYCAKFQKGEEPSEHDVISTAPHAVTHYRVAGVFGNDERFASGGAMWGKWKRRNGGYQERTSWASDTAYCPDAVDGGRIGWWSRGVDITEPVHVEVSGHDKAVVEARFAELWNAVLSGERPPLRGEASP